MIFRFHMFAACLGAVALLPMGCLPMSQTARSIAKSSEIVQNAMDYTSRHAIEGAVELKTRYNPCKCDDKLLFEVQIYEQWRHVYITGDKTRLAELTQKAQSLEPGEVFVVPYLLDNNLYTAKTKQAYYSLVVQ